MRYDNTVPSNYKPLPAVPRQAGTKPAEVPHDRLVPGRLTGSLELSITAVDPLRVGDGSLELVKGRVVHDVVRAGTRRPIVPGSTVKGVVRNLVEALGGGCDLEGPCNPLCVACSLFGTIDGITWKGRVGFEDAISMDPVKLDLLHLPRAFGPRRRVGRRVYGPAPPDVEGNQPHLAVRSGSSFVTRCAFTNLDAPELGLLLKAMGIGAPFLPRFGGGRYFGLGRARVRPRLLVLLQARRPRKRRVEGADLKAFLEPCVEQARLSEGADKVLDVLARTQARR